MTENITTNSYVSVAAASKDAQPSKKQQALVIPQDSFKIIAKISSSKRLSETEKSGLISNVALVEKYATGNLRSRLLNDITATTIFLERHGKSKAVQTPQNIDSGVQKFKQKIQIAAPVAVEPAKAQQQVAQVVKAVETLPQQFNTSLNEVKQKVSQADVQAVFDRPIADVARKANVEVKEIKQLGGGEAIEQFHIKDEVAISAGAQIAQQVTMPGSESSESAEFAVLGSGEFEEIALPGGGDGSIEADIAARVATLESRGIEELPLPGGVNVEALAAQILEAPAQAIESIGELVLLGGGEENGSVNDRAASVALSV
ncbi:MAG: hypothetical protein ACI9TY_001012 [Alphaproteobacteria bacterium]|jgi:hypothetical protein